MQFHIFMCIYMNVCVSVFAWVKVNIHAYLSVCVCEKIFLVWAFFSYDYTNVSHICYII